MFYLKNICVLKQAHISTPALGYISIALSMGDFDVVGSKSCHIVLCEITAYICLVGEMWP